MELENINHIFIAGDLHGDIDINTLNTTNFPEQKDLEGTNILFQSGDFGLVFDAKETKHKRMHSIYEAPEIVSGNISTRSKTEKYWLDWLDRKPFYTLFIGGNHENYDRLEKFPLIDFHGGKAAQISKKVFYLKNGYVYDFAGLKFWMFGGATSIDKDWRIEGISWWRQEIPSYKEMQFGLDNLKDHNYKVDYIITHTIPNEIIRYYAINKMSDDFTVKLSVNCPVSTFLDNVLDAMKEKYIQWYAGHFHCDIEMVKNITILYKNVRCIK